MEDVIDFGVLDIQVIFDFENTNMPSESSIATITDSEGDVIDEQALEDWEDFALNIGSEILDLNFNIFKEDIGKNEISRYYYLCAIDEYEVLHTGSIYKVRLSNHSRTYTSRKKDSEELRSLRTDPQLVEDNSGKPVKARFKSLLVNGEQFNSYDEAEERVKQELRYVRNKMLKIK